MEFYIKPYMKIKKCWNTSIIIAVYSGDFWNVSDINTFLA